MVAQPVLKTEKAKPELQSDRAGLIKRLIKIHDDAIESEIGPVVDYVFAMMAKGKGRDFFQNQVANAITDGNELRERGANIAIDCYDLITLSEKTPASVPQAVAKIPIAGTKTPVQAQPAKQVSPQELPAKPVVVRKIPMKVVKPPVENEPKLTASDWVEIIFDKFEMDISHITIGTSMEKNAPMTISEFEDAFVKTGRTEKFREALQNKGFLSTNSELLFNEAGRAFMRKEAADIVEWRTPKVVPRVEGAFTDAPSFDELNAIIDLWGVPVDEGGKEISKADMKDIIEDVKWGQLPIHEVPQAEGLRFAVWRLREEERARIKES